VPERQLTFSYGLGGIQQRFVDIFPRQVWVLDEDFTVRHAVCDHRDHRGDGYAQASDAG
jgi:hypothetical protein